MERKKGRKRGPVWDHWTKISDGCVRCNYCTHSYSGNGSNKRMRKHLGKCPKAPNNAKSLFIQGSALLCIKQDIREFFADATCLPESDATKLLNLRSEERRVGKEC